jgi:hypothetical protein
VHIQSFPLPNVSCAQENSIVELTKKIIKTDILNKQLLVKYTNELDELVLEAYNLTEMEKNIVRNNIFQ